MSNVGRLTSTGDCRPLHARLAGVRCDPVARSGSLPGRAVARGAPPDGPADGKLNGMDTRSPDIITAVEGQPVRTESELRAALRGGSGGVVSLEVSNPADQSQGRRIVRLRLAR